MFTRTFGVVSPDSNFGLNVRFFPAEEQHMYQCLDFPDAHFNSGNMDDYMDCMVARDCLGQIMQSFLHMDGCQVE